MMAINTITLLADLRRRIDNLPRLGTVEAVRAGECRVKSGELLTNWHPYLTQRAGSARSSWRPTKGEQVLLLSLSGDVTNAYVLPALYCDALPEPDDHPTRHRTVYPDGVVIEYDPELSALIAKDIKTAFVNLTCIKSLLTLDSPAKFYQLPANGGFLISMGQLHVYPTNDSFFIKRSYPRAKRDILYWSVLKRFKQVKIEH